MEVLSQLGVYSIDGISSFIQGVEMKKFIELVNHYYIEPAKEKGFWITFIIVASIMYWINK
jgi:hypothetical protein